MLDYFAGCFARTNSSWTMKAARYVSAEILAEESSVQDRKLVSWKRFPAPRNLARPYRLVSLCPSHLPVFSNDF